MQQKIHIQYLFAYKDQIKSKTISLSILTDDNEYIEYFLEFKATGITRCVGQKLRSIFEDYLIDHRTDAMVDKNVTDYDILYQYFMILRQHIGFKLSSTTVDRMMNRIAYYHQSFVLTKSDRKMNTKSKKVDRKYLNKIWSKMCETRKCPWITQEIDYAIQNYTYKQQRKMKIIRLAMYYMRVKAYLSKSANRHRQ